MPTIKQKKEIGLLYQNYPICIFNDNEGKYYIGDWYYDKFTGRATPMLNMNGSEELLSLEQIREKTGLDIVIKPNNNQHIILCNKTPKKAPTRD